MTAPMVSVVVVSRHRPDLLKRCIIGLSQQIYPSYEIVVVADPDGLEALDDFKGRLKTIAFDRPNISGARNLGIENSAGEIVAFIDDDSVPEPTWLSELVKGFSIGGVAATGGFVRGRNGITFQWKAGCVDETGTRCEIESRSEPFVPVLATNEVAKLEGTNMAVRQDALIHIGGFDPAFQYFLDETDMCRRLASAGYSIAFAPRAEVHHGFAANPSRSENRAPKTLFELGASKTVFLRKHANYADIESDLALFRTSQRARLLSYMTYGPIEPQDIRRLMRTLDEGFEEGRNRPLTQNELTMQHSAFLSFRTTASSASVVLKGRTWQRARLRAQARALRDQGHIVTVFLFGPSFRRHHVRFEDPGIWVQSGGLWGRSDRTVSPNLFQGFHSRVAGEIRRCRSQRDIQVAER